MPAPATFVSEDVPLTFLPDQETEPKVELSPYEKLRMQGIGPGIGATTGPANPQEVLAFPELAKGAGRAIAAPIQALSQAGGDLLVDWLRREGIDPSASPGQPIGGSVESLPIATIPGTKVSPLDIISPEIRKGVEEGAGRLFNAIRTPEMVSTLPFAGLKPVQSLYAAGALGGVPESLEATLTAKSPREAASSATEAAVNLLIARQLTKGPANAPQERFVKESVPGKRAGDDQVRTPAETGSGGGLQPEAGVGQEAQVPLSTEDQSLLSKSQRGEDLTANEEKRLKEIESKQILGSVLDSLPEHIRNEVRIKGIKTGVEFPAALEGSGGTLKNGWVMIEEGEPLTQDTVLHEVLHDYVNKHPELVDLNDFQGLEKAVDKLHSEIKSRRTAEPVTTSVTQPETELRYAGIPIPGAERVRATINKVRDTLTSLYQTRGIRDVMTYTRDVADNVSRLFGESQGNDVAGELKRVLGNKPIDSEALSFAVEAGGERGNLDVMRQKIVASGFADSKWGRAALAAIDHAEKNWDALQPVVEQYRQKTGQQIADENSNGINTPARANYVMHAQEVPDDWGLLSTGAGDSGAGFEHIRTHDTFADSIAAGVDPKTLNAVDLLKSRLTRGQQLINNRKWIDSLRTTADPKTGGPIVTNPEVIQRGEGLPADHRAPNGYHMEIAGGRPIAVLNGYDGLFNALTNPSAWTKTSGGNALLKSAVLGKSVALMVDTFHLARVAFWESIVKPLSFTDPKLPVPSYKKGVLLLDYTPEEIRKMGESGDLPQGTVDDVLAGKRDIEGLVKNGFNVGRITDAIHQEWMQSIPILGSVNKFIFKSFQRGAMAEVGVLEAGRYRRMHPSWTEDQVYREVAKDLNTRFGQLGRQGWVKSKTMQDLARLIFLAPQWNEGLLKSEFGAVSGAVKGVASSIKEGKPSFGVLPRAIGAMAVSQFVANQLINYATRGHPTWQNPEEGLGAKLSAWIPDVVGKGQGFFLHPLGLAAEVTHLMEMRMEKDPNFRKALLDFAGSRLSTLARPLYTYVTGRSPIGGKPIRPEDINKETAKSAIPLPIGGSAIYQAMQQMEAGENKEAFAGQYQKQLMSSFGVKTDQAPSPEQRIVALAKKFNDANGYKPMGEFYSGDYDNLSNALRRGALKEAKKDYQDLLKKLTDDQIVRHFNTWPDHPFTRSLALESRFYDSLSAEQKTQYEKARATRQAIADKFFELTKPN